MAGDGVGDALALAARHRPVDAGDAVPAVVAVHGVVAAGDGGDLGGSLAADLRGARQQLGHIVLRAGGRGVAPIGEGVDVDAARPHRVAASPQAGVEVALVGVDAAGADQAAEVQLASGSRLTCATALSRAGLVEEGAVVDGGADAGELLQDALAGADVEVADLGVAHLPFRQADRRAGGGDLGVRPVAARWVQVGLARQGDSVGVGARVDAVAVHHDQREWARCSCHRAVGSFASVMIYKDDC